MNIKTRTLIFAGLLVFWPLLATAEMYQDVYQWRDQHGRLQFSDKPPQTATTVDAEIESIPFPSEKKRSNWLTFTPPSVALDQPQKAAGSHERSKKHDKKHGKKRKPTQQQLLKQKAKRKQKCDSARQKYLAFVRKKYRKTDLASLKKRLAKRQRLNQKQKRWCS